MAELVFHRSGEPLLRLPIDRDRFQLGRGASNHLVLPDDDLLDEEAILELRPEGWWLIDASRRGTRLDAAIVATEAPLTDGAVLYLGARWTVTFRLGHPTSPGETRRHAGQTIALRDAGAPARSISLCWESEDSEGRLLLETADVAGIGHDGDNEISISDKYVSSFHARVFHHRGAWRLSDLGSTNGTFVDEVRVGEAVLEPGMRIRVGEAVITVEDPLAATADSSPACRHGIVTADKGLLAVLDQVERLGGTDATVTIFGESGTGKELVARAVHDSSDRATGPFIPVNCAAISKDLMESELFGHEKGAFTGAATARAGAFEEANEGTLFLDEVGELPLDVQAKLLRAIELKEVRRVGATRPSRVDVRIVAATNRDLHAEVRSGKFREDVFYRLYVIPLTLPPLRRREADVPLLAEHFIRTRSPGRSPTLTDQAREKLMRHAWPGNVRELRNTIERAILFHTNGRILPRDIIFPSDQSTPKVEHLLDISGKTLAEIEREAIHMALGANDGNRRMTARILGIARSTLQKKIKELSIEPVEEEPA